MLIRRSLALSLAVVILGALLVIAHPAAGAQGGEIVINEVVADNTSLQDNFAATPDWIELRNQGGSTVDLGGWTLSDLGSNWVMPSVNLAPGARLQIWASDRNLAGPPLHASFRLSSQGETLRIARPDGSLSDEISYPTLAEDEAWGRDEAGGLGYLIAPTPGAENTGLAPSVVTLETTPAVFTGSLQVTLSASLTGGQAIRYTTNGDPVSSSSQAYGGPITLTQSTVLRAAVEGGGIVGPERTGGYIAISATLANRSSDIPIVLVQSTGTVGFSDTDAIVSVINRSGDGRAYVLGAADYTGFAGLRIRGDSSTAFPKKQYKFELWDDPGGESRDGTLLDLGTDDDWGLYAPGRFDRGMIQNPFIYELGHRIDVPAPDYQFVELWLEDEVGDAIGDVDYQGLYLLRETIEIDDDRVDITKHTPTSAGADGGYIVRQDRPDTCCVTIDDLNDVSGGVVAVNDPSANRITSGQTSYIDGWWDQMQAAAANRNLAQIQNYIDIDAFIDYWLIVMISGDPDGWRLSTYFNKDAGGLLKGGPLWDYDRTMGSADGRNDELSEAQGWGINNLLINFDFVTDLWAVPEIQARLRARWAELRQAEFSDAAITSITNGLRDEILETYPRELGVWNGTGYGPRQGNGIIGEVAYMREWLGVRLDWIDDQLLSNSSPNLTNPGTINTNENEPVNVQLQVSGGSAFAWSTTDLPAGLTLSGSGRLSGTVAIGDAQTIAVTVTVTNDVGGQDTATFTINVTPSFSGSGAVVLNEYNAVVPGALLDLNGSDSTFGRVAGNGGDWFEVVTIDDNLDLRGWRFDLYTNDLVGVRQTASLRLGQSDLLSDIRAGTIITVAESVPEDLSYDPANGDWAINLQANTAQAGALWANQTDFDTNNTKWRLVVRDSALAIRAPIAGETEPWDDANFGVSAEEVMLLAADPTSSPDLVSDYVDGANSSFGEPNPVDAAGTLQDFSSLRPTITLLGDVNCSDEVTVIDALIIAQFAVGLRTDSGGCPLGDPVTQLNTAAGDVNNNADTNYLDALLIAQCSVGLPNEYCPD